MRSVILPTLLLATSLSLHANPFFWTGAGGDGNWSNEDNWSPEAPDWNADNSTRNAFQFIFDSGVQTNQTTVNAETRFNRMIFDGDDYTIETSDRFLFGGGNGGIIVDDGDIVLTSRRIAMNVFTPASSGGLEVNNGSLHLNVTLPGTDSGQISVGGTGGRYFPVDGNGTIMVDGFFTDAGDGGGIRTKQDFTGRLILNTPGSTISVLSTWLQGSGTVEVRTDDSLGTLPILVQNTLATLEAGNGARTLQNNVNAETGFRVSGDNRLTLAGSINLGVGSRTVQVMSSDGHLVFDHEVSGADGTFTTDGPGLLEITGDNSSTWSQQIAINNGELRVSNSSGSATGTGNISVNNGGLLSGNGAVEGIISLNIGGAISPGNSIGTLSGDSLVWNSDNNTAGMLFHLDGDGSTSDLLSLTGAFTKGDGDVFVFDFLGTGAEGQYTLVEFDSTTFLGGAEFLATNLASGLSGSFDLGANSLTLTVIPEPSSLALPLLGMALLWGSKRRRHSNSVKQTGCFG